MERSLRRFRGDAVGSSPTDHAIDASQLKPLAAAMASQLHGLTVVLTVSNRLRQMAPSPSIPLLPTPAPSGSPVTPTAATAAPISSPGTRASIFPTPARKAAPPSPIPPQRLTIGAVQESQATSFTSIAQLSNVVVANTVAGNADSTTNNSAIGLSRYQGKIISNGSLSASAINISKTIASSISGNVNACSDGHLIEGRIVAVEGLNSAAVRVCHGVVIN